MTVHSDLANRICVICCDKIPCIRNGEVNSHSSTPNPTKCRPFTEAPINLIKRINHYPPADIDYLAKTDSLPRFICNSCRDAARRNKLKKLPEKLKLVEWHKRVESLKSKKYNEHLLVENYEHIHEFIDVCPYICKPHATSYTYLVKGYPTLEQNAQILAKDELKAAQKRVDDLNKSKSSKKAIQQLDEIHENNKNPVSSNLQYL